MNFNVKCPKFSLNFQSYICIEINLKIFKIIFFEKSMKAFIMDVVNILK